MSYWQRRAETYGSRAVLNLARDDDVEAVTQFQIDAIFPHFVSQLQGDERQVLDFGCGPGRFTPHLAAATKGHAIGIDPIQKLVNLAPRTASVAYLVSDGQTIPLADASIDVAWVCLVMGGLNAREVSQAAKELRRVLKPRGLMFLVENTSAKPDCPHWKFRSVRFYQEIFAFAPLHHLADYDDLGETISILAGRTP